MLRPRYKRSWGEPASRSGSAEPVPVVLPLVAITIAEDGRMTVTVDGAPFEPEPFAPPWRREDFARVLDQLTDLRRSPVRVEVREADGTVFTDIITPSRRRRTEPDPEPASEEPARRPAAELVALHGEGFVPGEDVAIAVVIAFIIFWVLIGSALMLYLQALLSSAHVGLLQIVMMRFRKVNPTVIVTGRITAKKAGIDITADKLEALGLDPVLRLGMR